MTGLANFPQHCTSRILLTKNLQFVASAIGFTQDQNCLPLLMPSFTTVRGTARWPHPHMTILSDPLGVCGGMNVLGPAKTRKSDVPTIAARCQHTGSRFSLRPCSLLCPFGRCLLGRPVDLGLSRCFFGSCCLPCSGGLSPFGRSGRRAPPAAWCIIIVVATIIATWTASTWRGRSSRNITGGDTTSA